MTLKTTTDQAIALEVFPQELQVLGALSLSGAGNMKLRDTDEDIQTVENQKNFLQSIGIDYENFHYGYVKHGTSVAVVKSDDEPLFRAYDAMITKERGVYVGITVADCFPVYFYDAVAGICGVAHAGWRGTVKGIIPRTIEAMVSQGSKFADIHIEFGPGISQANFEFHYSEMIKEFGAYSQDKYINKGSTLDKITIDLQAILGDQIEEAGVPLGNLQNCRECTYADEKFFSARRHHGDSHDAMLAVIGMR